MNAEDACPPTTLEGVMSGAANLSCGGRWRERRGSQWAAQAQRLHLLRPLPALLLQGCLLGLSLPSGHR